MLSVPMLSLRSLLSSSSWFSFLSSRMCLSRSWRSPQELTATVVSEKLEIDFLSVVHSSTQQPWFIICQKTFCSSPLSLLWGMTHSNAKITGADGEVASEWLITLARTERLRKNCFSSLGQLWNIFLCFPFPSLMNWNFTWAAKEKFSCESGTFFSVHSVFALFARLLAVVVVLAILHPFIFTLESKSKGRKVGRTFLLFHHNFSS